MRFLFVLAFVSLAAVGYAAADDAPAALIGRADVARPGGDYATIEVADTTACAELCADDSLCMAWTFQENTCALKAVAPPEVAQTGAISGLSARAPEFLRRIAMAAPAEPAPTPSEPPKQRTAQANTELLGGPTAPSGLRPRLGE